MRDNRLANDISYAELLDHHPDIDRLHLLDRNMLIRPDSVWRLLRTIRSQGYDLTIDFASGSSQLSGACAILSGVRYRLASTGKIQAHLFNVHGTPPAGPIHVIDEILALLDQAAIPARTRDMMIHVAAGSESTQFRTSVDIYDRVCLP